MPIQTTSSPLRIRSLMPEGYLARLSDLTGVRTIPNLSQIVRYEQQSSKHWPAVESLARQTNPEGFAAWKAAQLQPAT
jgi:hypothetical protein